MKHIQCSFRKKIFSCKKGTKSNIKNNEGIVKIFTEARLILATSVRVPSNWKLLRND